ncbi:cell division protein FtsL [Lacticaseibacillus thailandensis]|uniref:Cell division protein FtsL n=1 Tax=Lacticaseibacillus thailandensis DSM 22698 = JCM 13996 TaxID=1423810 RepID=A0A0R2C994_9LACO|nr:hypothetical protein [Lacticaseibacillus thailandensis]KRM87925.1 hypothetical protein FD19_GL000204 [Lacticaseibacillus thailandensis DSM 22698 = JCM 13996]
MDSTARNFDATAPQLQPKPRPRVQPQPVARPQRVPFSMVERALTACIAVAAVGFALLILSTQFSVAATTRTYQNLQNKIASATDRVTNYQQSVGELTASGRLAAFAQQHGLTVNDSNIKQVTK